MSTDTAAPAPQHERRGYPPLRDLRRSRTDRHVGGLSGGLGRYAGIDPLVFRILFVVLTVFGGSGILLYALGWLVVPEEGESESEGRRLLNGRSTRSKGSVVALVVVVVVAVLAAAAVVDSGPGLGGLGVLAVIGAAVVVLLRNGPREPGAPVPGPPSGPSPDPLHGPVPPPAETGEYGQTPGTAYAAPLPPAEPGYPPPAATYPMYYPPAQPPPAPKEPSYLGRATLSVALIVVGLLIAWNAATTSDVPARVVIAAALGVVGLGLVTGAVRGRSRGLVVWGVLLTALASAAAFVPDVDVDGGFGERTWRPVSVADLPAEYRLGIGGGHLDLTQLALPDDGRVRVEVRQGVGELTVVIPDDVVVRVDVDIRGGELLLPDAPLVDGTYLSERVVFPEGSPPGSAVLVVDAELGLGSLEVRRATS